MLKLKSILHPTDFSAPAEAALQMASSLARDHGAKLVIMHVVTPPALYTGEAMAVPLPPVDLKPLGERLDKIGPTDGSIPVERRLCEGDTVAEILAVAKEMACDVIVMGTHGRTGLGRFLMGSVAEEVVRRAPCAVITIKSPLADSPASS
jgi:nucleotide-binding universal stress UspA family protein